MTAPTPEPQVPEAVGAFMEFLAHRQAEPEADFDTFAAEFPAVRAELGRMFESWCQVEEVVERLHSGTVSERIARTHGGVDPEVTLAGGEDAPDGDLLERLEWHRPVVSRYVPQREIARGGMGAVLRVHDTDLRRDLAMKVMRGQDAAVSGSATGDVDPVQLSRFMEEAQVTGQLEHPGRRARCTSSEPRRATAACTSRCGSSAASDFEEVILLVHARGRTDWTLTSAPCNVVAADLRDGRLCPLARRASIATSSRPTS